MKRMDYLDSVRGLAALAVVLGHSIMAFWPHLGTEQWVRPFTGSPLNLLWNGHAAVCLFFVLSGVVLSAKYFVGGGDSVTIESAAIRRYPRLVLPIFVSSALAYLMLILGLNSSLMAGTISGSQWLVRYYQFDPGFWQMVRFSLWDVFFSYHPLTSYNPPAWTMSIELVGSFIVFALIGLFGRFRMRGLIYVVLIGWFWSSFYAAFVMGVAAMDLAASTRNIKRSKSTDRMIALCALLVGILLLSHTGKGSWYYRLIEPSFMEYANARSYSNFINMIGATLVISALMLSDRLQRLLQTKPILWLGRVSFPLYLTHFIVLASVGSSVFVGLCEVGSWNQDAALTAIIVTLVASVALAGATYSIMERPALAMSNAFGQILRRPVAAPAN